jgi:hypothetical protein
MRIQGLRPRRPLRIATAGVLIGAALLLPSGTALADPPAAFTLSPEVVTLEAPAGAGSFDYEMVTLTSGPRWLVYQNPTTTTDAAFWDTQAGSCWQAYESLGNRIPGKTSCTIQVGFHSDVPGSFTGNLIVYRCLDWHADPTFGVLLCDDLDGSQSIRLVGTAT